MTFAPRPRNPFGNEEPLPKAYGRCNCDCHRIPGVKHCMPCCYPSQGESLADELPIAPPGLAEFVESVSKATGVSKGALLGIEGAPLSRKDETLVVCPTCFKKTNPFCSNSYHLSVPREAHKVSCALRIFSDEYIKANNTICTCDLPASTAFMLGGEPREGPDYDKEPPVPTEVPIYDAAKDNGYAMYWFCCKSMDKERHTEGCIANHDPTHSTVLFGYAWEEKKLHMRGLERETCNEDVIMGSGFDSPHFKSRKMPKVRELTTAEALERWDLTPEQRSRRDTQIFDWIGDGNLYCFMTNQGFKQADPQPMIVQAYVDGKEVNCCYNPKTGVVELERPPRAGAQVMVTKRPDPGNYVMKKGGPVSADKFKMPTVPNGMYGQRPDGSPLLNKGKPKDAELFEEDPEKVAAVEAMRKKLAALGD